MVNGEHHLKKIPLLKRFVSILNSLFLPFFGNTMFLPALALLLDMFVCDHQAQGKPYVFRDCYTNCWEGKHIAFILQLLWPLLVMNLLLRIPDLCGSNQGLGLI
jgi:hypothetical protein